MSKENTKPVEINLDRARKLEIQWADGRRDVISLVDLRRACPCASCSEERRERENNPLNVIPQTEDVALMATAHAAELVGSYALKITWCDGHDAGIYDFRYLRAMSD